MYSKYPNNNIKSNFQEATREVNTSMDKEKHLLGQAVVARVWRVWQSANATNFIS